MAIPKKPFTREEMYLAVIAGDNTHGIPDVPFTRTEMYLDHIAKNGGGGGGGSITVDPVPTGGSTNPVSSGGVYAALAGKQDTLTFDPAPTEGSGNPVTSDGLYEAIKNISNAYRYGVAGVGQASPTLSRIWDSVGMVAQVGTDGDNSDVINSFDSAPPFMRRKCVGKWGLVDGKPKFTVNAYLGDDNYTEDGTMGDYVAVECPRCYYYMDGDILAVSTFKYDGWRPFDVFCRNHDPEDTVEKAYLPAYALALKDGHAVSLPGLDNEQGAYKTLVDAARTYDGGGVEAFAILEPAAVNFYEWALFTVEFATTNCQEIMQGCANLRSADSEAANFKDSTHVIVPYNAARVAGQYVAITTSTGHVNVAYKATHKVLNVQRCNASGNVSSSGSYNLLEVEDLGKGYFNYNTSTTYYVAARPYRTGACNTVSTPSGSPVSNTDGYHPCKYRHRENPYGNQFQTIADLFNQRNGTSDSDYYLRWFYLLDPTSYEPASTSNPDDTDLASDAFVELDIQTLHSDYVNGYIKSRKHDGSYPDIWIPDKTTGGSTTTYYADYAYLVNSPRVRSVRLGGSWHSGATAGFSSAAADAAPSNASANAGGAVCFQPF